MATEAGFDGLESVLNKNISERSISSIFPSLLRILPVYSLHAPFMSGKGWGTLPLTRFLLQLKRLNYTGLLTLESMPAEFPPREEEIIRVLRDIVDYVRAQIE
ncbi:MAG: hypothetical protein JSW32_02245 [Deltaproteobacteria bacterium]|nr:MAG: hypothetical protein JSW32_02245 [Deltaproteobacteria bacterium]